MSRSSCSAALCLARSGGRRDLALRQIQIDDAEVERVLTHTLETTPRDATHWSTRLLANVVGLSQTARGAALARPCLATAAGYGTSDTSLRAPSSHIRVHRSERRVPCERVGVSSFNILRPVFANRFTVIDAGCLQRRSPAVVALL